MHPKHYNAYHNEGYGVDLESFSRSISKAERERLWFEKHFPLIITESVPENTLLAVNMKGIIDDMSQRKLSYREAIGRNCAAMTGLLS